MDILSGGLFARRYFMATDYTTSPINFSARVIYAVGCGVDDFNPPVRVFAGGRIVLHRTDEYFSAAH